MNTAEVIESFRGRIARARASYSGQQDHDLFSIAGVEHLLDIVEGKTEPSRVADVVPATEPDQGAPEATQTPVTAPVVETVGVADDEEEESGENEEQGEEPEPQK